jgi:hypothetical protein
MTTLAGYFVSRDRSDRPALPRDWLCAPYQICSAHLPYATATRLLKEVLPLQNCISTTGAKNRIRTVRRWLNRSPDRARDNASRLIEPSSCVSAPWGATVVSRNDRVTFRADLTVRARKHTDKSGLLKIGGAPNSAEIHYLTVAPGSHNAEVEGSSPSLTTIKPRSVPGVTPIFESSIRRDDKPDYDVGVAR